MTTHESVSHKPEENLPNFLLRLATAAVGGPLVLAVTYWGGWIFGVGLTFLAAVALLEFYALGQERQTQGSALIGLPLLTALLVAFPAGQSHQLLPLFGLAVVATFGLESIRHTMPPLRLYRTLATVSGLVYVGLPSAFLITIRALPQGFNWLVLMLALTWGTDTFAYIGGRLWGRHKLAPRISPKKTVEGAIVGSLGGFVSGCIWAAVTGLLTPALLPLLVLGPPAAILGDLFESRIKRFFHAGDSHLAGLNLIPGHGGVLDRIDSLTWVVTLGYIYIHITGIGV